MFLENNRGMILIMALFILMSFMAVVLICAFPLAREVDEDIRYHITLKRIQELKRSIFGRLADQPGGKDVTSCGGYLSDYGPNLRTVSVPVLLKKPNGQKEWTYENGFWVGYRGPYLSLPPGESDFCDGWGRPINDVFNGCVMHIRYRLYDQEIKEEFFYRINQLVVYLTNKTEEVANLSMEFIFPQDGEVKVSLTTIPHGSYPVAPGERIPFVFDYSGVPDGYNGKPTIGLRKIVIRDANDDNKIKLTKMVCIPFQHEFPNDAKYTLEIDYRG